MNRPSLTTAAAVAWLCVWALADAAGTSAVSASAHLQEEVGAPPTRVLLESGPFTNSEGFVGQAVQGPDGLVYAATRHLILAFDGSKWAEVWRASKDIQNIGMDAHGRLLVVGIGWIGRLDFGPNGQPAYRDLADRLPADYEAGQIGGQWIQTPVGIVMQNVREAYLWDGDSARLVWRTKGLITGVAAWRSGFVLADTVEGLRYYDATGFHPLPDGASMSGSRSVNAMATLAGGALLIRSDGDYIWILDEQGLRQKGLLKGLAQEAGGIVAATSLLDGRVAFVSASRLIICGEDGRVEQVVGLPVGSWESCMRDASGAIWLLSRDHLRIVQTGLPITRLSPSEPMGEVFALARMQGDLVAGTAGGLFRWVPQRDNLPGSFVKDPRFTTRCWNFIADGDADLMTAGWDILWVRGQEVRKVGDLPGRVAVGVLLRPAGEKDYVVCTGSRTLGLIRRLPGGGWERMGEERLLSNMVVRLITDPLGDVWAMTGVGKVGRLRAPVAHMQCVEYSTADGLPPSWVSPIVIGGEIRFRTHQGMYRFDRSKERFEKDEELTAALPIDYPQVFDVTATGVDRYWVGSPVGNQEITLGAGGAWSVRLMEVDHLLGGPAHVVCPEDGVLWFVGRDMRITRYDRSRPLAHLLRPPTLLRRVSRLHEGDRPLFGGYGSVGGEPVLLAHDNNFRFQFGYPEYSTPLVHRYRWRLEGYDPGWSGWAYETFKDYTNLPPGNYRFQVEARAADGSPAPAATYAFSISKPWHATTWAYLLYAAGAFALVGGILRWRLAALARHNRVLQKKVEERTLTIRQQADELQERALHLEAANEELSAAYQEMEAMNQSLTSANAEITQANHQLAEVNNKLEALNQEKNEFIGIASHDLKNPLGGIRGLAEIGESTAEAQGQLEYLETFRDIHAIADRSLEILAKLLDLNRIEQGRLSVQFVPCDLPEIARDVVEDYEARARIKNIQLRLELEPGLPLVSGDRMVLGQILDNLVSNAVKYSPHGKRAWVKVSRTGERIVFGVRDEGPGLTEEDKKRLFGKFARLSARPTGGESSNGLGLAIVQRLVHSLGGTIRCESEPGHGAHFIAEFQIHRG